MQFLSSMKMLNFQFHISFIFKLKVTYNSHFRRKVITEMPISQYRGRRYKTYTTRKRFLLAKTKHEKVYMQKGKLKACILYKHGSMKRSTMKVSYNSFRFEQQGHKNVVPLLMTSTLQQYFKCTQWLHLSHWAHLTNSM